MGQDHSRYVYDATCPICNAEESELLDSQTVHDGRTVGTSWHDTARIGVIDYPVHIMVDADEGFHVNNDEDGSPLARIPLPERHDTRSALARVVLGQWPASRADCPLCGEPQPDRPEPVDPASVRVVQIAEGSWPDAVSDGLTLACAHCDDVPRIDYRVGDEAWKQVIDKADRLGVVCLECYLARGGSPSDIEELQVTRPGETIILQPVIIYRYGSVPEPDPAAVEALAKILDSADLFVATARERVETARRLIRDHGVHVEVPDA